MRYLPLLALLACKAPADDVIIDTGDAPPPLPLEELVTIEALMSHLEALQAIADDNDGHRSGVSPGYFASVDYAESVLQGAGYVVQRVPFTYPGWEKIGPAVLEADGHSYADNVDIAPMYYSPAGDVTAPIEAVDLILPPTPSSSSTSGCEAEDFADFTPGSIALLQRGTCGFNEKATNAEAAGAVGAVIFNEGQPARQDLGAWRLDSSNTLTIPVLAANFSTGETLEALGPIDVHLVVDSFAEVLESTDLVADTPGGDPDQVVVVGGHLDSVPEGPGINDNGSGSALILELAVQLAERGVQPRNRVRFILYGCEELGLLGSDAYVASLLESELSQIAAKLNFDMVASPNGAPMIYDGDGSEFFIPGPVHSDLIEDVFGEYFEANELDVERTMFDGRSDYSAFIAEGIPAGGLFSGADGNKTSEEVALYGGTADIPRDPCYHQACDDIDNIDQGLYETLAKAAAYGTWELAELDWRDPTGE